jgi:hypothetical protein
MSEKVSDELYAVFIQLHKNQFMTNNVPQLYWNTILDKIKDDVIRLLR